MQRCLTPPSALEGDCGFLAANLYARSVFGEDALVNVSVEKLPDGRLGGYIRIRCAVALPCKLPQQCWAAPPCWRCPGARLSLTSMHAGASNPSAGLRRRALRSA